MDIDVDIREIRKLLSGYQGPDRKRYWVDLGVTLVIGWSSFVSLNVLNVNGMVSLLLFIVSSLTFYRALSFTHELVHISSRKLPGFRLFWLAACGIPLLAPHFLYRDIHLKHHSSSGFSTMRDAEYFPFAKTGRISIATYFAVNAVLPAFLIIRFSIMSLLSIVPAVRRVVRTRFSGMGIRLDYVREEPKSISERRNWNYEETATTLYCVAMIALFLHGTLPVLVFVTWYLMMFAILTLNTIRFLGATHSYHADGSEMSFEQQAMDGVVITRNSLLTKLLCPVGLQYHGLHHIVPALPGLDLADAHALVQRELPHNELYRAISHPSIWGVFLGIWKQEAITAQGATVDR
jgi:fatty acid desaturase